MTALRYLSVCAGIEAASAAWESLGWRPAAFAEIEPFPAALLAHRFPDVPNLGDMTRIRDEPPDVDLLVGGTPCQAFSVAGARRSLDDARGNLTLEYVRLADAIDARRAAEGKAPLIGVWENVPGVLNTKDNAFGCFLGALAGSDSPLVPSGGRWSDAGCVYGPARTIAWRLLDAQYFGLAQRRRRVFVVWGPGGFDAAGALFPVEEGVRRDSPPCRPSGEGVAAALRARSPSRGVDSDCTDTLIPSVAHTLLASSPRIDAESETLVPVCATGAVTHTLTAEGHDAGEDGSGRGTPIVQVVLGAPEVAGTLTRSASGVDRVGNGEDNLLVPMRAYAFAFQTRVARNGRGMPEPICPTLTGADAGATSDMRPCVAYPVSTMNVIGRAEGHQTLGIGGEGDPSFTITTRHHNGVVTASCSGDTLGEYGVSAYAVRRLTPTECERLQGFPDGWTDVPFRGKPAADGNRYKALGNSMAVPCMAWLGRRIAATLAAQEPLRDAA